MAAFLVFFFSVRIFFGWVLKSFTFYEFPTIYYERNPLFGRLRVFSSQYFYSGKPCFVCEFFFLA